MPETDPENWLYRLTPAEWLTAAENELAAALRAAAARQHRAAVTQARRAAGMALNALLHGARDPGDVQKYRRSYMDHLRALAADETVPEEVRAAAQRLLEMPLQQEVVVIGKGNVNRALAEPAELILRYVRSIIAPAGQA